MNYGYQPQLYLALCSYLRTIAQKAPSHVDITRKISYKPPSLPEPALLMAGQRQPAAFGAIESLGELSHVGHWKVDPGFGRTMPVKGFSMLIYFRKVVLPVPAFPVK